jgi:hypothetical protein
MQVMGKWSWPVPAFAVYITRLSSSSHGHTPLRYSHAVGSNPYGLGRSPSMTSECSSLRCICPQTLPPSSGLGSLYSSETWIFKYQTSWCQNINLISVRTTNITRHNAGQIFQQITALARAYMQGQSEQTCRGSVRVCFWRLWLGICKLNGLRGGGG